MSNSINANNNNKKNTPAGDLKANLAFSTGISVAPGAVSSVIRNKGIRNAVSSLELEKFKKLKLELKEAGADSFTRAEKLSESYDTYKGIAKKATSLSSKAERAAKRGDISLWQKFKNLFSKNKVTVDSLKEASKTADKELKTVKTALEEGKTITKNSDGLITAAASEAAKISSKTTVGNLFKSELKNPIVIAITAFSTIPRLKEEVAPVFKEKGFFEGIKATGKVLGRAAIDFVSNAGFSAIGRAIGMSIGSIFPGVGTAIGGTVGDIVGSTISSHITTEILDEDKEENIKEETAKQETTQQIQDSVEEITVQSENNAQSEDRPKTSYKINPNDNSFTGSPALDEKINKALSY